MARDDTVQVVDAGEAKERWSSLLDQVAESQDRVIIERDGVPVAAVISTADLQRLRRLDAERERDFAVVERMRAAFKDVPFEEIEREAAKALAEVRDEMRKERADATSPSE